MATMATPTKEAAMKIVHSEDVAWTQPIEHGRFAGRRKELGGERLTAGLWELPPGKRSFPMHVHYVTEEAMWVISGRAKVHTADGDVAIGPGDYVSFPAGGPAHQLINDGNEPLLYLAMSAVQGFDIVEYPDSDKVAARVGTSQNAKRFIFRKGDQVDYWEGEE
jgi:uncharacterized cupin superfamily protein